MTTPSIFISYSQDSDEHKDRVLRFADRLRDDGLDANLDQYQVAPKDGWQLWMEKQIRDSKFVLLVCTETYLRRVMKEDSGKGLGVMWESTIIYQYLYNAGVVNERFIPIVFGRENIKHIPMPLQSSTYYDINTEDGYEALYRRLTDQPYTTKPELGKLKSLPRRERKTNSLDVKISLAHLPSTSPDLFGRENELKELDDAWANPQINVVTLVAWGGVGKSALVNKWLTQMARDNYRGAERVYGWSFYSQGAAEGRQVSADQFIATTLAWFGDPDPTRGSPWDKGERLAELVKNSRALIILDGLEPLQNPPPVETGRIKDPALVAFLRELARQNSGLVVITTRLAVDDLKDCIGSTAIERDLESLSDEAGAKYLKHLGVDGTEDERKEASHEFGGHALALTLMGRYLVDVYDGDVRKRNLIPHLTDEEEKGGHAKRIMRAYEKWFEGKPERDLLTLMGLFDRPAEKGAMDVLLAAPVIEGLTDKIQGLPAEKYKLVLKHLRKARLLADNTGGRVAASGSERRIETTDALDCHPLLREHFGEQLKETNPAAWREGNNRLYEYYKASAKEFPDTLQEMAPLFAAVMHGCQAGRHQEAMNEVYFKRIQRGNESFNTNKLGAIGSELAALSSFFDDAAWRKPANGLSENTKGFVLNEAGFDLRALGRLAEAAQPMQASLNMTIERKSFKNATRVAINISDTYNILGALADAIEYAKQSVELADHSGHASHRRGARATLGYALHQAGHISEAEFHFREAEKIQKVDQPNIPILYSGEGFQYCDLLLTQGNYVEVERRVAKYFKWRQSGNSLLDVAHEDLSLGRAYLLNSQRKSKHSFVKSLTYLNNAVDGLRKAGQQHELPLGLLARAEYYCVTGDLNKSQKDLDEAFSISTRGGMGLHLADCHLEYARLSLARGMNERRGEAMLRPYHDDARAHLSTAKAMIEKMGYHRRDKEVEELEKLLAASPSQKSIADAE